MTTWFCDAMGWDGTCSGVYIMNSKNGALCEVWVEKYTSNQLEYMALIATLEMAEEGDIIFSDSQLVVKQLLGEYEVRNEGLKPLHDEAKELYDSKMVKVTWCPRSENKAGVEVSKHREALNHEFIETTTEEPI